MLFDDERHELDVFDDCFYRDLESGWSANLFFCESCIDEFLASWPLAYSARDAELQRTQISLDDFYSGSRMGEAFSHEDFVRLIGKLHCPNCDSSLGGSIWPYCLPFDIPDGFYHHLAEIGKLAERTPFLLLTEPLCVQILTLVQRLGATAKPKTIVDRLFRARRIGSSVTEEVACFDFPPANVVAEGRYNHAGRPVLYAASQLGLCVAEMRDIDCLVIGFFLDQEIRTLDLLDLDAIDEDEQRLVSAICYSALVSAPQDGDGWHRPAYVFTRFLADCAYLSGYDAIKYLSTRVGAQNGAYNLVILNPALSLAASASGCAYERHMSEQIEN